MKNVGKHYLGVYIGGLHANVSPNDSIALIAAKKGMNRGQANKEAKMKSLICEASTSS